jgi:serine/threonine-protein kinase
MSDTNPTASGATLPTAQLLDLLLDEQQRRWHQGERIRVEDFLDRHLELRRRPEAVLDLIAREVVLRQQAGEAAAVAEYQVRFPHLHEQLRDQFAGDDAVGKQPRGSTLHSEPAAPGVGQSAAPGAEGWPAIPGCEIRGVLGRGGMGLVLHGRDPDLGRDLAVKVLRDDHAADPDVARRFVEEAQIGGQLQHPGVVPVHALGRAADGRPYFTMKLVKGRTLADLLKERTTPAQELPRFLGIFQQVCQTLAYAHSKGVIHRDLKPQNVMVGTFGEVQVMDWGLAKVLGGAPASRGRQPPEEAPSALRTVRTEQSGASSQAGSVLGTPAYMAPEQARGDVDRIDERADVFGLGAILCEILTSQPPYTAAAGWQVYPKAVAAELTDALARLQACGADAELLSLAQNCLAADPEKRPRNAGAVVQELTTYLVSVVERFRAAELAAARSAARAEQERKARRLTVALAASVLALVVLGGGGWLWLAYQRAERQRETARAVEKALAEATSLRGQAKTEPPGDLTTWSTALAAARRAQGLLERGEGNEELRRRVRALLAELNAEKQDRRMIQRLEEIRLRQAAVQDDSFHTEQADPDYAEAFVQYGIAVERLSLEEVVARIRRRPIKDQLAVALDDWAMARLRHAKGGWQRFFKIARLVDDNRWRNRLRDALSNRDRRTLMALVQEAQVVGLPASTLADLGGLLRWLREIPAAVTLLRKAQQRYPDDFWVNHQLAHSLISMKPPQVDEAIRFYSVALALRSHSPGVHLNLGNAFVRKGQLDEAVAAFRKAIFLKKDYASAYNNLGIALQHQGLVDQAIAAYIKAIHFKKDFKTYCMLASAYLLKGEADEAITACRKSIRLSKGFSLSHYHLGVAMAQKGQFARAITAFQEAIRLEKNFAEAHFHLGNAFLMQGWPDRALACFRRAIRLKKDYAEAYECLGTVLCDDKMDYDAAIDAFQTAIRLKKGWASAYRNLGIAYERKGRLDEALAAFKEAIRLKKDFAEAYDSLGAFLCDGKRDYDGAIAAFRRAIRLKRGYAEAHFNLGNALQKKGQLDQAIVEIRHAIRLKKDFAEAYNTLGIVLLSKGQVNEAVVAFKNAIRLKTQFPQAYLGLGMALQQLGRFAEGLAALKRGHELGSRSPNWPYSSAQLVKAAERLVQLNSNLAAVLQGKIQPPAVERVEYAVLCGYKKLHGASARFYTNAFTADPKLTEYLGTGHRYNAACAAALAAAGQGKDAGQLDARQRRRWRQQALAWLRADLGLWDKLLKTGTPQNRARVQQELSHWQRDPDLAGIRDAAWLVNLPADELRACRRLWAEVDALLQRAGQREPRTERGKP